MIPDFDDFEDYDTEHIRRDYDQDTERLYYSGTLEDCDEYEVIEPIYDLAYVSPSFVKKAFYGLRGHGEFPDFNDKDKKTSLYHPETNEVSLTDGWIQVLGGVANYVY